MKDRRKYKKKHPGGVVGVFPSSDGPFARACLSRDYSPEIKKSVRSQIEGSYPGITFVAQDEWNALCEEHGTLVYWKMVTLVEVPPAEPIDIGIPVCVTCSGPTDRADDINYLQGQDRVAWTYKGWYFYRLPVMHDCAPTPCHFCGTEAPPYAVVVNISADPSLRHEMANR